MVLQMQKTKALNKTKNLHISQLLSLTFHRVSITLGDPQKNHTPFRRHLSDPRTNLFSSSSQNCEHLRRN